MCRNRNTFLRFGLCALLFSAVFVPFLSAVPAAAPAGESEAYAELYAAYRGSFYPGVVRAAKEFETRYPRSILLPEVRVYAGESLFRLGRISEAEPMLTEAAAVFSETNKKDRFLKGTALYWLGRVSYSRNAFDRAAQEFSRSAALLAPEAKESAYAEDSPFFASLRYGARSCLKTGNAAYAAQAVPVLEYLWRASLPSDVFSETTVMLFAAYRACGSYDALIRAFGQLSPQSVSADVYGTLALQAAEAFTVKKDFSNAYSVYAGVVRTGVPSQAVIALQRAWELPLSADGSERAALLTDAGVRLHEYPQFLAEFRTRLGTDGFGRKNYRDAEADFTLSKQYLEAVSPSPDIRFLQTVNALYLTEIRFRTAAGVSEAARSESKRNGAVLSEAALSEAAAAAYAELSAFTASLEADSGVSADPMISAQLCRYACLSGNWKAARAHGSAVLSSAEQSLNDPLRTDTAYWYALAEMQSGNGAEAVRLLETYAFAANPAAETIVAENNAAENIVAEASYRLYANALFSSGQTDRAFTVYEKLSAADLLGGAGTLDYAKAALRAGMNARAYELAAGVSDDAEAPYIAALASINRRDWQTADTLFSVYLAEASDPLPYALFYQGYARYLLGRAEQAYASLTAFSAWNPSHALSLTADRIAAVCAVQMHQHVGASDTAWIGKAVGLAESIVKRSEAGAERESAVLFAAGVYDDAGAYEAALDLMKPYLSRQSPFGMNCRYRSALLLVKRKQYDEADALFADVERSFPTESLAEDASYRRGESYYTAEAYETAAGRFASYRRTYPRGKYADAASYFGADCFARIGQPDQAILLYESLLSSFPASTFAYGSLSALIPLYREKGEYAAALRCARAVLQRYGDQVEKSELSRHIAELELLVSGAAERTAVKLVEFEAAGKTSTAAGRKAGVELGELYLAAPATAPDGAALLEKIYTAVKKPSSGADSFAERDIAARCAYLLGTWNRAGGNYAEAAQYFLSAAEYYTLLDGELSARSLYGAAESFDSARRYADARRTVEVLRETFPDSVWAARAAAFGN